MTITRKELVKTAKEFNELMGFTEDEAIKTTKDVTDEYLKDMISQASELLEEEDEISETAQAVLDYIAEETEETAADAPAEEVTEEASEEQTTEQLVEESDYKALKAMVAEYPEFKGIDIALYPVKKAEELRTRMLKELAKKAAKKAPAAEVKEEKPAAKKDVVKKDAPAKKAAGKEKIDYSQYKKAKSNKELDSVIEAYWKKHLGKKTDKGITTVVPVCEKHPEWDIDQVYAIFTKCAKSVK